MVRLLVLALLLASCLTGDAAVCRDCHRRCGVLRARCHEDCEALAECGGDEATDEGDDR